MLPILVQHLPSDRERLVQRGPHGLAAEVTRTEYWELEPGRSTSIELYERIVDLCGLAALTRRRGPDLGAFLWTGNEADAELICLTGREKMQAVDHRVVTAHE